MFILEVPELGDRMQNFTYWGDSQLVFFTSLYKVVQIWPGLFVCKQVTVCPDHIWTTLQYFGKQINVEVSMQGEETAKIVQKNL
jgi:hypothetical protein